MNMIDMRAELTRQIEEAGGLMAFCRKSGLSHPPVSAARHGHRAVTDEIALACGFVAETTFRKI